jgi:hypothetical protein
MGGPVAAYVAFSRDTGSGEGRVGLEAELPYWAGLLPSRAGRGRKVKIAVASRETRAPVARGAPPDPARLRPARAASRAMQLEQFNLGNNVPHYDGATAGARGARARGRPHAPRDGRGHLMGPPSEFGVTIVTITPPCTEAGSDPSPTPLAARCRRSCPLPPSPVPRPTRLRTARPRPQTPSPGSRITIQSP